MSSRQTKSGHSGTFINLVLMLAFPYASILVFSAFGPVLRRYVGVEPSAVMSTVFLAVLAISMVPPPTRPFRFEQQRWFLPVIAVIGGTAVGLFGVLNGIGQWVSVIVFAISLGRIAVFWSRTFLALVSRNVRGRVVSGSLFVAYGLLYAFNVFADALPVGALAPAVAVLIVLTIPFFQRLPESHTFLLDWNPPRAPGAFPWVTLAIVFLVYTTAGFTYAGVFPELLQRPIDRYYNVLPFVLSVPLAGRIADRYGRTVLLYTGVAAVGLALVFFQLSPGWIRYGGTQTAIQVGWAFLDVYVWVMAADLVFEYNRAQMQNIGVATFLIGTVVGSALTLLFYEQLLLDRQYFLWILPLFAAVALMGKAVRTNVVPPPDIEADHLNRLPPGLALNLTDREQEISLLLITGIKNREICERLHISQNTLKTHCRHIYRKLDVENRMELRELVLMGADAQNSGEQARRQG